MPSANPTLEVVICTKDRPGELARCLESLAAQTSPPERVLVVDGSSTPVADAAAPPLQVERIGAPASLTRQRNVGLSLARADLVAFLDDDVEIERDYLRCVRDWFAEHPGCVGVSGNITNDPQRSRWSRAARTAFGMANDDGVLRRSGDAAYLRHPRKPTRVDLLSGANMVYRRGLLDGLEFDERVTGYSYFEDADFSLRAGDRGELWMLPGARLLHHNSPRARAMQSENVAQVLAHSVYFFRKHKAAHGLRRAALIRRVAGRTLGYIVIAVASRSWEPIVGILRGLRRV